MIKRILIGIGIVLVITGCTPEQLAAYEQTTGIDISDHDTETLVALPDTPMRLRDGTLIDIDGSITAPAVRVGPCGQYYGLALDAGFTDRQWPTVSRIMWRESRCQPGARNRSGGASGLMQIMPMWADDCGGSRSDLFVAWFNLRCAVHILSTQGWSAWATR